MRIQPLIPNLCCASQQMALETYESLQDAVIHGYRVRKKTVNGLPAYSLTSDFFLKETTITDFIVLNLARNFPNDLRVFDFTIGAENISGADLMVVVNSNGVYKALVLQAKLSKPTGGFKNLHQQQAANLVNFANTIGAVPAYLLYAYWTVGAFNLRLQCSGGQINFDERQWAISIAHAQDMINNVFQGPFDLGTSQNFSDPWMCLFCGTQGQNVAEVFEDAINRVARKTEDTVPEVSDNWRAMFDSLLRREVEDGIELSNDDPIVTISKSVKLLILISDKEPRQR